MTAHRAGWQRHLVVLLLYGLLSLALTLPLAPNLATHVPGDGIDDPALAWNLWWIKASLVDHQLNPFPTSWMFYPLGINLAFYTLTVLNGLLSIPLQLAFGLVPASNLVLLSSYVLGAFGAYLLSLQVLAAWTRTPGPSRPPALVLHSAAFLAGLVFAFSSSKLFYAALGQFNIASSQWVPFAALYILRSGRPGARLREPLLAGLFVVLQAYAELTYASFLVVFIVLYAAFWLFLRLARPAPTPRPFPPARLLAHLAVLAVVVAIGLAPILANMLPDMRAEGDFLVEGGGFADLFSADLAGYWLPTQLHSLWGDAIAAAVANNPPAPGGVEWQVHKGQHVTLGYVAVALAVLGLWAGRRWAGTWFFALAALVFFLLTLGPTVRWAGHDTGIPGPFQLLQVLPFFKGNRYPSRWAVMLLLSVAPLVALGAALLLSRVARWRPAARWPVLAVAALLAGALLLESLSIPLPLSDMRVPGIYDLVAADESGGTVLDLPLGWRNGFSVFGKQDPIIMASQWWQTTHQRPILSGNTSRNPEHKFRYFLEAPLIGALAILANADDAHPHVQEAMAPGLAALQAGDPTLGGDPVLQDAAAQGPAVLAALGIRALVVHRDHVPEELVQFVERYLPVRRLAEEGQHVLYAVDLPAVPAAVTVRPALDPLSRGEGWSGLGAGTDTGDSATATGDSDSGTSDSVTVDVAPGPALWAQRRQTRAILPPVQPGATRVAVQAKAAGPGQTLALEANGHRTPAQPLPETWTELVFDLPAGMLRDEPNEVTLHFGDLYPVRPDGSPPATTAGLLVESAGLEAGDYGHIWLNGRDVSLGGRGYNLAIVDAATGQLVAAASFDTHADPAASAALVDFLRQFQPGQLLAVAVRDTAADQLSAEAAAALTGLGLSDLRGRFRWSQAALVLPDGQVLEQLSPVQPVAVGSGPGWREPQVAAAVASITAGP